MAKILRKVIKIDEELCNGCGLCVPACAEGAIQVLDGKARLVSDTYCDGLGACLGECPQGAITFEEREAEQFDEAAAMKHVQATRKPEVHTGCPGSRMLDFSDERPNETPQGASGLPSELRQWPVKLHLVNPAAPYFRDADLLLAADCTAFAYGSLHPDFLRGRALAIGCPKLDDMDEYIAKLRAIIEEGGIRRITVLHMEVPCCLGLLYAARKAVEASGRDIPVESEVISIRGELKGPSSLA